MYRQIETQTIEYVALHVAIYKWQFDIRLYDTYRRISER